MRKPSLTFDTFVAALAVLGVSVAAETGCGRAERGATVAPEPPAAAPTAEPSAGARPEAPTPAENAAPPPPPPAAVNDEASKAAPPSRQRGAAAPARAVSATDVDAGAAPGVKKANMACGAGSCTPDMKKGNPN